MQQENLYIRLDGIRDSVQARDKRLIEQGKEIRELRDYSVKLNDALTETTSAYAVLQCDYAKAEEDRDQDRSVIEHLEYEVGKKGETITQKDSQICVLNENLDQHGEIVAKQGIEIRELRRKLRKFEVKQDARDMINTTKFYWDCECDVQYTHPRSMSYCVHCRARRTNQPDSRLTELTGAQLGMINHHAEQYLQTGG